MYATHKMPVIKYPQMWVPSKCATTSVIV